MIVFPPAPELVNAWVGFLTPMAFAVLIVVQLVTSRVIANRAKEVKQDLAITSEAQIKKMDVIVGAVNGAHGESLRVAAGALERVAAMSEQRGDVDAAKAARERSDAHAITDQK